MVDLLLSDFRSGHEIYHYFVGNRPAHLGGSSNIRMHCAARTRIDIELGSDPPESHGIPGASGPAINRQRKNVLAIRGEQFGQLEL